MNTTDKLHLIEEALDLDLNSLSEDMVLAEIPNYDSMAKLSLIVLADDEFNKKMTGEQLREFKTVADILNFFDA